MELKRKYIFDMHVHTSHFSLCSRLSPGSLVRKAIELKLDGIVITDHGKVWSDSQINELKESTGAEDLIILSGQEVRAISRNGIEGDAILYGIKENIPEYLTVDELLNIVKNGNGVAVAAHPRRNILSFGDDIFHHSFDGIEILNSNYGYSDVLQSIDDMAKLTTAFTAGSDAHTAARVGNYLTFFDSEIRTIEDIVSAVRNKTCRPACGIIDDKEIKALLMENNFDSFLPDYSRRKCIG